MTQGRKREGPAKQTQLAERRTKAVQLRLAGASFDDIARTLGYSDRAHAYRDIQRAMEFAVRALTVDAEELRALEVSRLDRLQQALWSQAMSGEVKAVDSIVRIISQRSRLLGLEVQPELTEEQRLAFAGRMVAPQIAELFARTLARVGLTTDQRSLVAGVLRQEIEAFLAGGGRVIEGSVQSG